MDLRVVGVMSQIRRRPILQPEPVISDGQLNAVGGGVPLGGPGIGKMPRM